MPTLTIIRGASGSGKSTLAKALAASCDAVHFEADMYFYSSRGEYQFDSRKLKDAHNWCQKAVEAAMIQDKPAIVSNTFVKLWEMKPYLDMAVNHGYIVQVIHCQGKFKNVHGVSDKKVQRMRDNFEPYVLP